VVAVALRFALAGSPVRALGATGRSGRSVATSAARRSASGATNAAVTDARPSRGIPLDPALFTAGSCEAFAPTAGDRHETVFIDAGHGGPDPGAIGRTSSGRVVEEAVETLPVALDTTAILRSKGYRVVVSRTRQTAVARPGPGDMTGQVFTVKGEIREIGARDVCANLAHASVLVAVYFDAGGSALDAGSVTGYDRARPFWRSSLRLARLVQRDVVAGMNAKGWAIPDDGVVSDITLGGIPLSAGGAAYGHLIVLGPAKPGFFTTPSLMPGALIEPLFITDPFEGTIAARTTGQRVIAAGIAKGVEQYFAGGSA